MRGMLTVSMQRCMLGAFHSCLCNQLFQPLQSIAGAEFTDRGQIGIGIAGQQFHDVTLRMAYTRLCCPPLAAIGSFVLYSDRSKHK